MARSALASLLGERKELLVERWSLRVRAPAGGDRRGAAALPEDDRCHVPKLIDQLRATLSRGVRHGEDVGRGIGRCRYARDYARLRFEERGSLAEVLRELSLFRMLLLELCEEHGVPLEGEEARLVHATIDEGMLTVAVEIEEAAERELRRAVEFRDRFMGVLGHDLRNPLSCVAFTAASLLERGDTPPGHRRALQRIGSSVERMSRMISDLLDLTRAHGGGIPVAPRPVDIHALCRQVVEELEASHPGRAILIGAHGDGRGVWDPDRLAQVVSNLVKNALDYSPPDTPVRVEVTGEDDRVSLAVTNLGPLIPDDEIEQIFEPFRRGSGGQKGARRSPGLGLGLFIARQIVAAHGGAIAAESTTERGTTFTVRLPRGEAREEGAATSEVRL